MERMMNNTEGFITTGRPGSNLALQLRYAAERGRAHDVRRLLEAGAGIHKDSVSKLVSHRAIVIRLRSQLH